MKAPILQVVVPPGKKESDYIEEVLPHSKSSKSVGRSGQWSERYMEDVEIPWRNFSGFPKQSGKYLYEKY